MNIKTFICQVYRLLQDIILAFLNVLLYFFKDLKSFRNRLVVFISLLGLIVIFYNKDAKVIISVVSIIGVVFSYYFKIRNDSIKIDLETKKNKGKKINE